MSSYPVTKTTLAGLKQFPNLAEMIVLPDGNRGEKEIFRLLGTTHYGQIKQLLQYLDKHISSTGEIGNRLLAQKDYFQFSQNLAEFFSLCIFNPVSKYTPKQLDRISDQINVTT